MLSRNGENNSMQMQIVSIEQLVPADHFLRKIEAAADFNFIYDLVEDKYTVHPGNEHDSKTFPILYNKLKLMMPKTIVVDAGYKTPAIAKLLIDDGITPIMPYTRPRSKKGFFRSSEYIYDEYYDCYICPNNQVLRYSTTNREGYREYKSDKNQCEFCPYLEPMYVK